MMYWQILIPFLFARGLVMRMCILKLYPLDSLIHPFPVTGCTINGTYPSYHRAEVGNKWTSPSHTHTPMPTGDLELPVHLQHAYLRTEGGSQSTRREPTHAQGEHVKLHTEKPRVKIDPGTFLLWGDSTCHCTSQPPLLWLAQSNLKNNNKQSLKRLTGSPNHRQKKSHVTRQHVCEPWRSIFADLFS